MLEPDDGYGPEDAAPMQLLPKTFVWASHIARNLTFRMHLVNRSSSIRDDDGSFILQFHARCIYLLLGDAPPPHSPPQIQLLNQAGEKVGYAWNILALASFRYLEINLLLLSLYKTDSAALNEWTQIMGVDDELRTIERWDLINVMLVQSQTLSSFLSVDPTLSVRYFLLISRLKLSIRSTHTISPLI